MEEHKDKLSQALAKLPSYMPEESAWLYIEKKIGELPLHRAIDRLPSYEPDETVWNSIEEKSHSWRKENLQQSYFAAAIALIFIGFGWVLYRNQHVDVVYSAETADQRLQVEPKLLTDKKYEELKDYCRTETLLCNSHDFLTLSHEYDALREATEQLQEAIGPYNSESALIRQFHELEQQKTDILNKMAGMI